MKIQINRMNREYIDLTELKRELENKYNRPQYCKLKEHQDEGWTVGYFCPHCGSELQGMWKINYLELEHENHGCVFCPEEKNCEELKKILEEELPCLRGSFVA